MIQPSDDLAADSAVRAGELADWLGVSERTIAEYARRGIIARSGRGTFPLKESVRAVASHFREQASQRGTTAGLSAERERKVREEADKLAMQNAAARREMVSVAAVADEWSDILRLVRSRMLAAPSRIQQQLGHLSAHDLDVIDRELRDALTDLSNNGL
jgi:phage terminase Nu1 subunit (DNA packaging protein)